MLNVKEKNNNKIVDPPRILWNDVFSFKKKTLLQANKYIFYIQNPV